MKRLFIAGLVLASAVAWAIPNPKQIESALAAHDYTSAKQMVAEVLSEQPASARAHLLNAYILVHADHNPAAAAAEVKLAKNLDKRGDVKNSSLFGRTVTEIDMARVPPAPVPIPAPAVVAQQYVPPAPALAPVAEPVAPAPSGHGFFFWLFWIALIGGGGYFIYRKLSQTPVGPRPAPAPMPDPVQPVQPTVVQPTVQSSHSAPVYRPVQPSGYTPAPAAPQVVVVHDHHYDSGLATAAVVGAGAVLAADLAYESGRRAGQLQSGVGMGYPNQGMGGGFSSGQGNNFGTAPATVAPPPVQPAAPAVDFESERASFSSGRDDDAWTPPAAAPAPEPERDDPPLSSSTNNDSGWSSDPAPSSGGDDGSW